MTARLLRTEALIAAAILIAAGWWATTYIRASMAAGRAIDFYSELAEPALMLACGRGFHAAERAPEEVTRFLAKTADRFSCAALPATLAIKPGLVPQGSWLYLMLTVAAAWRLLGFAWSAMPPLWGLFFGLGAVAAYVLFRIAMSRGAALVMTGAFAVSSLQLLELPNLRDYAKTPFILGALAALLAIVRLPFSAPRIVVLSAIFGVLVGVGYGYKPDTLILLPLFVATIALFLPSPLGAAWPTRGAAVAAGALACAAAMWPVLHETPASGNNLWHVALIGLMPEYGDALGVRNATYRFGIAGSDEFVEAASDSSWKRLHPDAPPLSFTTAEYEASTRRYFLEIASRFPADLFTRTISSITRMPEVAFGWPQPPIPGFWDRLYAIRERVMTPLYGWGVVLVAVAIAAVALTSARVALFLLAAAAYVGAYPVIEFHNRNFFYLEVMAWLAVGFLATSIGSLIAQRAVRPHRVSRRDLLVRAGAVVAGCAVVAGMLGVLRAVQTRNVRRLITAYVRAATEPAAFAAAPDASAGTSHVAAPLDDPSWSRLLRVEADPTRCHDAAITFRYDVRSRFRALASSARLPRDGEASRIVLFEPVYAGFSRVEVSPATCPVSVASVVGLDQEPLWLPVRLHANWRSAPLYESIETRANIH